MKTAANDRRAARRPRARSRAARSGSSRRWARSTPGHVALFACRARRVRHGRREPVRQRRRSSRSGTARRLPARPRAATSASRPTAGVDFLFAPPADELYPPGFATWVEPAGAAEGLEGEHRPGHFRGVATVCLKLFNIVRPDARVLRAQGRAAGRGREAGRARPRPRARDPRRPDGARRRRARALLPQPRSSRPPSASARSRCRARSRPRDPDRARDGARRRRDRARLRRRRRPRRPDARRRRPRRLDPPDRQRPPGRSPA